MIDTVPTEISLQVSLALKVIERHLKSTLLAVHLYGSAVEGGLKPYSDIDLLVTVTAPLDEAVRRTLFVDLVEISAPPEETPGRSQVSSPPRGAWRSQGWGSSSERKGLRALEVTIVVHSEVSPWRYPARRELQFGEWQRKDILDGVYEPAMIDTDLTVLLTLARRHSIALVGPAAEALFEPVPKGDLFETLADTLKLWNSRPDWEGDERNVVLALARIWYSAETDSVASKESAANWALERLPTPYRPVLLEARQAYLGQEEDCLASRAEQLEAYIHFVKNEVNQLLGATPMGSDNSFKPPSL